MSRADRHEADAWLGERADASINRLEETVAAERSPEGRPGAARPRLLCVYLHGNCERVTPTSVPPILIRTSGRPRSLEVFRCLACGRYWRDADFVRTRSLREIGLCARQVTEQAAAWAIGEADRRGWLAAPIPGEIRCSWPAGFRSRPAAPVARSSGEPLAPGNPHGMPLYRPR